MTLITKETAINTEIVYMNGNNITITIVGFGNVGRCILHQLLSEDEHSFQINLVDPDENAYGSFLDLSHASFINEQHQVIWNDPKLISDSDYIFHCAGANISLGNSRLSIINDSISITRSIFSDFKSNADPTIIVIANPVDIITFLTFQLTGLPPSQVVGTGTFLDTIRMKYYLRKELKDNALDIDPILLGEHGESIVLSDPLSKINQQPLSNFLSQEQVMECLQQTKNAASKIKELQGATYYAVSNCAVMILKELLSPSGQLLPLSVLLPSHLQDLFQCPPLAMSIPTIISEVGVFPNEDYNFSTREIKELTQSARILSKHITFDYENNNYSY